MNTEPTTPEEQKSLEGYITLLDLQARGEKQEPVTTSTLLTDLPVASKYSSLCKVEPSHRLTENQKLKFHELVKDTTKAICLCFLESDTGEAVDEWFPKGVCANLNLTDNTVYVWDKFLRDAKPYFLTEDVHHAEDAEE